MAKKNEAALAELEAAKAAHDALLDETYRLLTESGVGPVIAREQTQRFLESVVRLTAPVDAGNAAVEGADAPLLEMDE